MNTCVYAFEHQCILCLVPYAFSVVLQEAIQERQVAGCLMVLVGGNLGYMHAVVMQDVTQGAFAVRKVPDMRTET